MSTFPSDGEVARVIRIVRAGDRDAYATIVHWYQDRLYALAFTMTRDREGAEEVTQDAFVRAFERLDVYDDRRPFFPWIATIATRLAQGWLRTRGRAQTREAGARPADLHGTIGRGPLDDLLATEAERSLWNEVARLPSGERTAVHMFYRDDMPVSEIAKSLGVTSGTIKTLLFRARRRLRQVLNTPEGRDLNANLRNFASNLNEVP